jgi:hypothetical protein
LLSGLMDIDCRANIFSIFALEPDISIDYRIVFDLNYRQFWNDFLGSQSPHLTGVPLLDKSSQLRAIQQFHPFIISALLRSYCIVILLE